MAIKYRRGRIKKIVSGTDITGVIIGISALDDADSNDKTNASYMEGTVMFSPVKESLTKADIDQALIDFRAQKNKAGDIIDKQLANDISVKQASVVISEVHYNSLPAS